MWRGTVIICLVALVAIDGLPNHEIENARYDSSFQANGRRHQKASAFDAEHTSSLDVDDGSVVYTQAGSQRARNSEADGGFDVNQSIKEEISNDGGVIKHSKTVSESRDESQSSQDSSSQSSYYVQAASNVGDGHKGPINHGHRYYNPSIPAQPVAPIVRPVPIRHSSLNHLPNHHIHHDGNLRNANEFYHDNHGHYGHSNDGSGNFAHNPGWYGNGYVNHSPNGWFRRYVPQSGLHPHRHFGYQPVNGYQGVGNDHYNRFHNYEIGNPSLDARNRDHTKVKYVPTNGQYGGNSADTKPGLDDVLNALGYNHKKDKPINGNITPNNSNHDNKNDGTKVHFVNGNDETNTAKHEPVAGNGNIPELGTPKHPAGSLDHVLSAVDYARGPKKTVNYVNDILAPEIESIQYVPAIVPTEYLNRPVNYGAIGIEVPESGILIPEESEEYVPNVYGISPVRYVPVAENIPEYVIPKQRVRYYENPVPYVGSPVVIPEETSYTNERFVPEPSGFNGFVQPYNGQFRPEPTFVPEVSYSPTYDNNPNKKSTDVIKDTVIEKDAKSINNDASTEIIIDRAFITKESTKNSEESNRSSKQSTTTIINKTGKNNVDVTPLDDDNDISDDNPVKKSVPVQKPSEPNNDSDKEPKTPVPEDKGSYKIKKPPVARRIPIPPKNIYPPRNVIHKKIDAVPIVIDKFSDVPEKSSVDKTTEIAEKDVINQNSDLPYVVERRPVNDDAKPKTSDTDKPTHLENPNPVKNVTGTAVKERPEKPKIHVIRTPSGVILHKHEIYGDLSPKPETKEVIDNNKPKIVNKKPDTRKYIYTPKKDKDLDQNVHGYNPAKEISDTSTAKDDKLNPTTQKPIPQIGKPIPRIPKLPDGYIVKTRQPKKLDDVVKPTEDINQRPVANEPAVTIAPKTSIKKEDDIPDKVVKTPKRIKNPDSQNDNQDSDDDDEYYKIIKSFQTNTEEEQSSSSQNSRTETRIKRILRHKNRKPGDNSPLSDDDDTFEGDDTKNDRPANPERTTKKPRNKITFKVVGESNDESDDSDDDDYLENTQKSPSTEIPNNKQPIKPEIIKNNQKPNIQVSTDKNTDKNAVTTERNIGSISTTKKPDVTEKPSVTNNVNAKGQDKKPVKGINTPNEKKFEDTSPKPDSKETKDDKKPTIVKRKPIKDIKPKKDKDLADDDDEEFVSRITVIENSEDSTFNSKQHRSVTETEEIIRRSQKKPVKKPISKTIPDSNNVDDEDTPNSKTDKKPSANNTDSNKKPVTEKSASEKKPDSANNDTDKKPENNIPKGDKKPDTKNPQDDRKPNKPDTGDIEKPVTTTENAVTDDKKPKNGPGIENKSSPKSSTTEQPSTDAHNTNNKAGVNTPDSDKTPTKNNNKPDSSTKKPETDNVDNKAPDTKTNENEKEGKAPVPTTKVDNPIRKVPIIPDIIKPPVSRPIDSDLSYEECDSMEDTAEEEITKNDKETDKPVNKNTENEETPGSKNISPKPDSITTTEKSVEKSNDQNKKTPTTESSKKPNTTEAPKDKQPTTTDKPQDRKPDTSSSEKEKKQDSDNDKKSKTDDDENNKPKTTTEKQTNVPTATENTPTTVTIEKDVNTEKPKRLRDCDYFGDVDCEEYDDNDDDDDDRKTMANTTESSDNDGVIDIEEDLIINIDDDEIDSLENDVTEDSEETVSDEDISTSTEDEDIQDNNKKPIKEEKPEIKNADDNKPVSGSTTTVKPDAVTTEQNKKPSEYPTENKDKPVNNIKKPSDNNDKATDNGKKPNKVDKQPNENGKKPTDNNPKPTTSTEKPTTNKNPIDYRHKPSKDGKEPNENNKQPEDSGNKPIDKNTKPIVSTEKPTGDKKPVDNSKKPAEDNEKPSKNNEQPKEIGNKPTDSIQEPTVNKKPIDKSNKPIVEDKKQPRNHEEPNENDKKPTDNITKPTGNVEKPTGNNKPTEDDKKRSENSNKPNDSVKKPNENSSEPTGNTSTEKPTGNKKPDEDSQNPPGSNTPTQNTEKPNVNITENPAVEIPDDVSIEDKQSSDDIDSEEIVEIDEESDEDYYGTDSENVDAPNKQKPTNTVTTDKPKSKIYDCDYFGAVDCENYSDDDIEQVTDKQDDTTKPIETEKSKPDTSDKNTNKPINQQAAPKKSGDNKKPDANDDGKDGTDINEKPSTKPDNKPDATTQKPKSKFVDCDYFGSVDCEDYTDDDSDNDEPHPSNSDEKKPEDNKGTEKPKSGKKPEPEVVGKNKKSDSIFKSDFYNKDINDKSNTDTDKTTDVEKSNKNKEVGTKNDDKKPDTIKTDKSVDKNPEHLNGNVEVTNKPDTKPNADADKNPKSPSTDKNINDTTQKPDNITDKLPVSENTVQKPDTKTTDRDGNKDKKPNTKDTENDKNPEKTDKDKTPEEQNPNKDEITGDKDAGSTGKKPGSKNVDKISENKADDTKPNKTPDSKTTKNGKKPESKNSNKDSDDTNKKPADKHNNKNESPDSKDINKPDSKPNDKKPSSKTTDQATDKKPTAKPSNNNDKPITETIPDKPDTKTPDNNKNKKPKDIETNEDGKPSSKGDKPIVNDKDVTDKIKLGKDIAIDTEHQSHGTDLTIQRKVVNSIDEVLKYRNREGFTFKACDETETSDESSSTNQNRQVKLTKFIRTKKHLNKKPVVDDKDDTKIPVTDKRPVYRRKRLPVQPRNEIDPNSIKNQQIWLTGGNRIIFRKSVEDIPDKDLGCLEKLFRSDGTTPLDGEISESGDSGVAEEEYVNNEDSKDRAPLEDIPDDNGSDGIVPLEEDLINDKGSNYDGESNGSESNTDDNQEESSDSESTTEASNLTPVQQRIAKRRIMRFRKS